MTTKTAPSPPAASCCHDAVTPNEKSQMKWFQAAKKQWQKSPRKKLTPLPAASPPPSPSPSFTILPIKPTPSSIQKDENGPLVEKASLTPFSTTLVPSIEKDEKPKETSRPVSKSSMQSPINNEFRNRLVAFYQQHNPSKLSKVDSTLESYKGREELLFQKLQEKYVSKKGSSYPLPPSKDEGPVCFLDFQINNENVGRVRVELFSNKTPMACENFRALCTGERGMGRAGVPLHYKKSTMHRIVPNFCIQGGDFTKRDGTGGESIYNSTTKGVDMWGNFCDETFMSHSEKGLLCMANNGPNRNRSQFFFTLRPLPSLDGKHVVFGRVIEGINVLDKIASVDTDSKQRPIDTVVISDCGQEKEGFSIEESAVAAMPVQQSIPADNFAMTTKLNDTQKYTGGTSEKAIVPKANTTADKMDESTTSKKKSNTQIRQAFLPIQHKILVADKDKVDGTARATVVSDDSQVFSDHIEKLAETKTRTRDSDEEGRTDNSGTKQEAQKKAAEKSKTANNKTLAVSKTQSFGTRNDWHTSTEASDKQVGVKTDVKVKGKKWNEGMTGVGTGCTASQRDNHDDDAPELKEADNEITTTGKTEMKNDIIKIGVDQGDSTKEAHLEKDVISNSGCHGESVKLKMQSVDVVLANDGSAAEMQSRESGSVHGSTTSETVNTAAETNGHRGGFLPKRKSQGTVIQIGDDDRSILLKLQHETKIDGSTKAETLSECIKVTDECGQPKTQHTDSQFADDVESTVKKSQNETEIMVDCCSTEIETGSDSKKTNNHRVEYSVSKSESVYIEVEDESQTKTGDSKDIQTPRQYPNTTTDGVAGSKLESGDCHVTDYVGPAKVNDAQNEAEMGKNSCLTEAKRVGNYTKPGNQDGRFTESTTHRADTHLGCDGGSVSVRKELQNHSEVNESTEVEPLIDITKITSHRGGFGDASAGGAASQVGDDGRSNLSKLQNRTMICHHDASTGMETKSETNSKKAVTTAFGKESKNLYANTQSQGSLATRADKEVNYRERLLAFYQKHNPSRIDKVDSTLASFKGREDVLFQKLEEKYINKKLDAADKNKSTGVDSDSGSHVRNSAGQLETKTADNGKSAKGKPKCFVQGRRNIGYIELNARSDVTKIADRGETMMKPESSTRGCEKMICGDAVAAQKKIYSEASVNVEEDTSGPHLNAHVEARFGEDDISVQIGAKIVDTDESTKESAQGGKETKDDSSGLLRNKSCGSAVAGQGIKDDAKLSTGERSGDTAKEIQKTFRVGESGAASVQIPKFTFGDNSAKSASGGFKFVKDGPALGFRFKPVDGVSKIAPSQSCGTAESQETLPRVGGVVESERFEVTSPVLKASAKKGESLLISSGAYKNVGSANTKTKAEPMGWDNIFLAATESWKCNSCKLFNKVGDTHCFACNAENPDKTSSRKTKASPGRSSLMAMLEKTKTRAGDDVDESSITNNEKIGMDFGSSKPLDSKSESVGTRVSENHRENMDKNQGEKPANSSSGFKFTMEKRLAFPKSGFQLKESGHSKAVFVFGARDDNSSRGSARNGRTSEPEIVDFSSFEQKEEAGGASSPQKGPTTSSNETASIGAETNWIEDESSTPKGEDAVAEHKTAYALEMWYSSDQSPERYTTSRSTNILKYEVSAIDGITGVSLSVDGKEKKGARYE